MNFIQTLKKTGRWAAYIFLGLLLVLLLTYGYSHWRTEKSLRARYALQDIDIDIPGDSASIARGAHLYTVHACGDCHAPDLRGKTIMEDPMIGRFTAPNLTSGKGGLPAGYGKQDWLRALKLGIDNEGRSLVAMPSVETARLPDRDLADLVAFCRTRPPVDHAVEATRMGPLIRVLVVLGKVDLFAAEQVDQKISYLRQPEMAVTAEFGATLAVTCTGCHRENLKGGPSQIPGQPPVPDISSSGRVAGWNEEQFVQTLRTGITPDGHRMDNAVMPWERFREFSDVELKALRMYLISDSRDTRLTRRE